MTIFIPTTLVSLYRGDATDEYGDPVNSNTTPIRTGLPCALTESLQQTTNPSAGNEAYVDTFVLRFRPGIDVREGDRVRDERSGRIFYIDTVSAPQSVVGVADVRCSATYNSTA